MSYCTVNGFPVTEASIQIPRVGAWHADFVVDTETEISGKATVVFGTQTFVGFVKRGEVFRNSFECRVVGGAGGLGKMVTPTAYLGVTAGIIINAAIAVGGEILSPTADATTIAKVVDKWTTLEMSVGSLLTGLSSSLGVDWRVLPDGTVWVGTELWKPSSTVSRIANVRGKFGSMTLEDESPGLMPGTTFNGKKIDRVGHELTQEGINTMAWSVDE